jgi:hypothetical protein
MAPGVTGLAILFTRASRPLTQKVNADGVIEVEPDNHDEDLVYLILTDT